MSLGWPTSSTAQYFGRNKVQYKRFTFQVLRTEHFDVYFYPEERAGAEIGARLAERWYARLSRLFTHELTGRQPLILYASHADFEQTNVIESELGEGTGGVTEPLRRRIVLPLGGPLADTDHVIGHELVHAFQFDLARNPNAPAGESRLAVLPLWFVEGMAEYLSIGPDDPHTAMWLRDAVRQEKLPSVDDLDNPKYFPYRWGQALWAYIGGRWGETVIPQMLDAAASGGGAKVAIERVLGLKTKELSADWHAATRKAYEAVLAGTTTPAEVGRTLIKGTDLGGEMNVGPALSPNGRWVAFLSERSYFSIDLYIADAASGHVTHKLTSTSTSAHYSSLQFIYSAGGWDSGSRRFVMATVADGRPTLAIFDAVRGKRDRDIPLSDVDEVFNPSWAPDGHAICFAGMSQGVTDLFVYDLGTSTLRQITNDAYADLQPTWSPDGRSIAFVTDRFSTNLDTLKLGAYRLALFDLESAAIREVRTSIGGKNINPQWAADSRSLYFISDHDGISNLFRVGLDPGSGAARLTSIATGITGITASSPALSVASQTGLAAFSVYQNGRYDIHTLDVPAPERPPAPPSRAASLLPPLERQPSDVAKLIDDPAFGLPSAQKGEPNKYVPKLMLERFGQPTVGVGMSRYGAAVGGGISLAFSDMLNNHVLQTAFQFNSGITGSLSAKDLAAQAAYINQERRWNWGVAGGQIPYLSGAFQSGLGVIGNEPAAIEQMTVFRETDRRVSGFTAYPLDRSRRLEFGAGLMQVSFDQTVRTTAFSLSTGSTILDTTAESRWADPLTLGTATAAYVFDTSSFGATSPVRGRRYRVEVSPNYGTINFTTVLEDYREYLMPIPFYTVAARVLHYGRYGSGGEDPRMFSLYLGYPSLVRGYDVNSFSSADCVPNARSQCPAFDDLFGSRLLVGNLEFRFPLLRPFGVSQRMYGPLPVEVALFTDYGVAWNRNEAPTLFRGGRESVSSAGVTFRVNLAGVAIGQFDLARPLQRPGAGWVFQFSLSPGF